MNLYGGICNPKVSIIIPVYNVKQYIAEALESVINQTYTNLEIIIIDDGSNDGSEIICDEYAKKDKRIKLIHKANSGLSAARNTGLDNAFGDYITFLDSDDVFMSEAIEKSLNALLTNNVDCVSFKYIVFKKTKNIKFDKISKEEIFPTIPQGLYSKKEIFYAIVEQKMNSSMWTKLSKREIWDKLRFPEGHVYEDLSIIMKMIDKINNIYVMDDILVLYRQRSGSITKTGTIENIEDYIEAYYVYINFAEKNMPEIFDEEKMQILYKKFLDIYVFYYAKILSFYFVSKSDILRIIKERIIKYEKKINIKNCFFRTKLIYYMIFNHKILLLIFFPFVLFMYNIVRKMVRNFVWLKNLFKFF